MKMENFSVLVQGTYFAFSGATSLNHSRSILPWSVTSLLRKSCTISNYRLWIFTYPVRSLFSLWLIKTYLVLCYLNSLCQHVVHPSFLNSIRDFFNWCTSNCFIVQWVHCILASFFFPTLWLDLLSQAIPVKSFLISFLSFPFSCIWDAGACYTGLLAWNISLNFCMWFGYIARVSCTYYEVRTTDVCKLTILFAYFGI